MRIFIILFIAIGSCAHAAAWDPSVAISFSYECISGRGSAWSSARTSAEINAAAVTAGVHTFSIPVALSYSSESTGHGSIFITDRISGAFSLRYTIRAMERLSFSASADAAFVWHIKQEAGIWEAGGTVSASIDIMPVMKAEIPFSLRGRKGSITITAGLGLRLDLGDCI